MLINIFLFSVVVQDLITSSTSPPWAPIPGINKKLSGIISSESRLGSKSGLNLNDTSDSLTKAFTTKNIRAVILLINSPGGSVTAGLAIYDTMQQISPDIVTICFGVAASMGAFLLSGGTKGKRLALPNSRIMIHQPLGGAQGQAVEIEIQAKEILYLKKTLNSLLAEHTGQSLEKIVEDTERDYFLSPEEAVEYGLIDKVIKNDN